MLRFIPISTITTSIYRHGKHDTNRTPQIISDRRQVLIRGYDCEDRIVANTGQVIDSKYFTDKAIAILEHKHVEYPHVRSVTNNCFFAGWKKLNQQEDLSACN